MMYRSFYILISLMLLFSCSEENSSDPEPGEGKHIPLAVEKTNSTKIYVHYMPWYETPETNNGVWGQHWTMASKNPEITDSEGRREAASYFYPSIGLYASSDEDVIECHLLLMKYSGIDGVIIDWYGTHEIYDYPANKSNSEALIKRIDKVGLTFAVMYEDRTLEAVVNQGAAASLVEAAKTDFSYMNTHYFNSPDYIKIDGNPLLTVFGPISIQKGAEWTEIANSISSQPVFLSLWGESGELGNTGSGEFSWIWQDNSTLENFYASNLNRFDFVLGSAYPGYVDFYSEGGWGEGAGWSIEHRDGETLRETLDLSASNGIGHIQVATWNDFGEGTMIEPTLEFGTQYLEILQEFSGTPYGKEELDYIIKQYELRKSLAFNPAAQSSLDQAFNHWVKLETEDAKAIIDELQ